MVKEKLIDSGADAPLERMPPKQLNQLLQPIFDTALRQGQAKRIGHRPAGRSGRGIRQDRLQRRATAEELRPRASRSCSPASKPAPKISAA